MFLLFIETSKDVEIIYRFIGGFELSYEKVKRLSREARRDELQNCLYIYIDLKNEGTSSVCNEKPPEMFIECTPETNLF